MINLRVWFKDKDTSTHFYNVIRDLFKLELSGLRIDCEHTPPPEEYGDSAEFFSHYASKGYVSRVILSINYPKVNPTQFYSTSLLAAEALDGRVEVSLDGSDFRVLGEAEPFRNETISILHREELERHGIKVVVY